MTPFKFIKGLFFVLLCVSIVGIGVQRTGYYLSARTYAEAQDLIGMDLIELPPDPVPAEAAPPETEPPETEPAETIPPETEIPETEPAETIPPETEIPETESAETIPPETEIPETEPAETTPPETLPPETVPPETEAPLPEPEPVEIDEYAVQLRNTDLSRLNSQNGDVVGWIVIPGTTVSYPLLQGDDNAHYLTHSWEGLWNPGGSIFLDYRSDPSLTDFHSIIYGHRMYDDSMFNGLKNYADEAFAAEHPSVYLRTADGVRRYDVFAAYEADAENGHSYRLGLTGAEDQQKLINYGRKRSVISPEREVLAENGDRMLTLSTCTAAGTSEARWVVHFVLAYELLGEVK